MRQDLSGTSYALLGLLAFDGDTSSSLTGYELKQRADRTLRFYWVSPAMSQVYTELERLAGLELVTAAATKTGRRRSQHYQITHPGLAELERWLTRSSADFPVLKHPIALRLLMGALIPPERTRELLASYLEQLAERAAELVTVRRMLGERDEVRYPAMVADWGLSYYESEVAIVSELMNRLPQVLSSQGPGRVGSGPRGRTQGMTSTSDAADDYDQDSEPTMTAPFEGRPDGIADESAAETQSGVTNPDADDQSGAEAPAES